MNPSSIINKVSIYFRPDDPGAPAMAGDIADFLSESGVKTLVPSVPDISAFPPSSDDPFVTDCDLVVVMGGDGTFLRAARLFAGKDKPLFGINRGRVGFLTEFRPDEYKTYLNSVLEGVYSVSERITLEVVRVNGSEETSVIFVNDAVLSKGALSRPVRISVSIDGVPLIPFSGDGLIVATPTGSTAYSLSAGGPIISPDSDGVYLVTPVCPHTLAMRPIVVAASSVLSAGIESDMTNLLLTIDGQEGFNIGAGDEMFFRISDKRIKVITHPEKGFYAILNEKLGLG